MVLCCSLRGVAGALEGMMGNRTGVVGAATEGAGGTGSVTATGG